jgi:cell division protein FtsW
MAEQPVDVEVKPVIKAPPRPADAPPRPVRATPRTTPRVTPAVETAEPRRRFWQTLDTWTIVVVGMLLAIGLMMVYSTTFDWSYQRYGSEGTIFFQHLRNAFIGLVILLLLALIDYRVWRRLAVPILLLTIGALIAVLLFGDDVFNARRALINGSFQPGELAELTTVIYMAAWLGSRRTQIRSITYGLIPFMVLVGIVAGLVLLQPDISTAATIIIVAAVLFFLAGADLLQLAGAAVVVGLVGVIYLTTIGPNYAQGRVESFLSGTTDIRQADYHVQQAIKAFTNGGWTGVGLGQGRQKYANLPAPHTDSIFAVIGEELGVLGAMFVVSLYIALVVRGLQVARRACDSFGMLLAAGITIWIAIKALLNIAVMVALVPPTGAALPFISFGGSSLVVVLAGVGLILSVARVRVRMSWAKRAPERSGWIASHDRSGGNGGTRLPRARHSRSA